jgi:hypothetical protein
LGYFLGDYFSNSSGHPVPHSGRGGEGGLGAAVAREGHARQEDHEGEEESAKVRRSTLFVCLKTTYIVT